MTDPPVEVTLFTDPACPFAFSAEPARLRLRWHYGDGLRWEVRMIVLTLEPGEAERLAEGAPGLQRRYGMPITPDQYARPVSSQPACRAVVAARLNAPGTEQRLLRALRVRTMAGGLLDDPDLIAAAAVEAGLDPTGLERWTNELRRRDGTASASVPGFNPVQAHEAALASIAPELDRRPQPDTVLELLSWAEVPLATAEVVAIMQRPEAEVRTALGRFAHPIPAGADMYWSLPAKTG